MAKTPNTLNGWQYLLQDEDPASTGTPTGTPSRRSRRGAPSAQKITLKRTSDDLEIKAGDTIFVQHNEASELAFIKEIKFGNDNFLDVWVAWLVKAEEIHKENLKVEIVPNEIMITPYLDEIMLVDIIDKVQVLSFNDFKEIVIDDSSVNNIFTTRRGCDIEGGNFTDEFDWKDILKLFEKDPNELMEWLRVQTIPPAYKASPKKRVAPVVEVLKKESPSKKRKVILDNTVSSDDEKSSSLDDAEVEDEEDDEEDEDDEEEEEVFKSDDEVAGDNPFEVATPTKKSRTPRKLTSPSKSPRKLKSPSKSPSKSKDFLNSVSSPRGKIGYNLKLDFLSTVSLLSPNKPKINQNKNTVDKSNSHSKAIAEVKAKLHTSAKVSSLPGREDLILTIYEALEHSIREQTGTCLYVSGTPGVGKTATVREVISQLNNTVEECQLNKFDYVEINGLKLISPSAAYEKLWYKISDEKVTAANAAILLESYFKDASKKKNPLVVLMDELDQIVTKKQNVMYNFFNWPTYENSKLIVIAIANTMDLPERVLTNKISSRLGLNRVQFKGYTFDELGAIIKHRLDMLTKNHKRTVVIKEDAIGFASRKVASVSGDARRALTICRRAVEIAEQDYLKKIKETGEESADNTFHVQIIHISQAINETINSPLQQFMRSLSFTSKLVLAATLLRNKRSGLAENSLGDVIDEMKNSLQMLTSKKSNAIFRDLKTNSNLTDMLYGNGILGESDGKVNIRIFKFKQILTELVEYGIIVVQSIPSERYKLIQLNVSSEDIYTALAKDPEVGDLMRTINA